MKYAALEAGGTKMVCAIGDETGHIFEQISIPTLTPEETMPRIIEYFKQKDAEGSLDGLGIACFGPVGVNPASESYGTILDTPKLSWKQYPILKELQKAFPGLPMGFDTDVNGSCLGEVTYGSAKGLGTVVYYTIGTGIGAGIYAEGKLLHGMLHPEAGHIPMAPFPGDEAHCICPYHKGCFEGFASGPSIEKRYGKKAIELVNQTKVWELEADYIATALCSTILTLSPERIILGGGVMHQEQLFPLIRRKVTKLLGGYINTPLLKNMDTYIVPASLHDDQGIMGCIRLAELAGQTT